MKTQGFQKAGLVVAAAVLAASFTVNIFAQDTTANPDAAPPQALPVNPASPDSPLSLADQQVVQLVQAKIGDGTIITYIQNSGTIYGLDPSQIVYLKQQGVSEPVINAMLNQRSAVAAQVQANTAANATQMPPPGMPPTATVAQPSTPPPATTYVVPDSQTYDYDQWATPYVYPYYGYGWPVGVYWGWPGYYGGWHGGYYGGWHGGGGFHGGFGGGGFHGGFGGGGFHGGGGWHH